MNNINDDYERPPLWKQQVYETPANYERFSLYYLPQTPPRSYTESYVRYLVAEKGKDRAKIGRVQMPGHWIRWALCKDQAGNPVAGGVTWQQKAMAWDEFKRELKRQDEIDRSVKMREDVQKTLRRAQDKIDGAIKALSVSGLSPDELIRLMRAVYTYSLEFYDLRPPDRIAVADDEARPFGMPTLEEWRKSRLDQLSALIDGDENEPDQS